MEMTKDTAMKDTATSAGPEAGAKGPVQMRLNLKASDHADQPLFANFTTVQGAPGMVFVDFGFLEPAMLPSLARLSQSGGRMPEQVNGRLACRVVMGLDAATQLARQLEQLLHGAASPTGAGGKPN